MIWLVTFLHTGAMDMVNSNTDFDNTLMQIISRQLL